VVKTGGELAKHADLGPDEQSTST